MRQQEFERANELFLSALQKGQLTDYLGGFSGYRLFNPYADSPTDPSAAFEPIRSLVVDDQVLKIQVLEALQELSNNREYGWMSIHYIHSLRLVESAQKVKLIPSEFINAIADGLRKNKAFLMSNVNWVGADYKDGLWGDVRRMNKVLTEKYNLTILPEEL